MRTIVSLVACSIVAACTAQSEPSPVSVAIESVDPSGDVVFVINNMLARPLCTSNAGVGTMKGESSIRLERSTARAFPIVYDWFGEDGPSIEKIVIDGKSRESFTVNLYDDFTVEDLSRHNARVYVAVWDCSADVPLYTTYEHEAVWGPGYLKDKGVRYLTSQPVSITLDPTKTSH